ncbi:Uncharacterized protein chloroplastic [Galdieria sulphuraria]|uniref:Uncharacterized protein n=1 Tax=Galdieria sulphuraria TaxID=130081 RepID=M2XLE5_GALSU|nr:uncharacterized protein Gasu_17540 [Galdieria sulphuraria]EME30992.1 hypothetical protein Gasu_17540 [Galdieria sulphuraria]GJD10936.1 Uncharacterized protein chloroplastic [Galdieria sulphuraria]|eukprot:XP_005707512.1 hypothetical protein Gasu_17540 [Galdieria sulphuraria]
MFTTTITCAVKSVENSIQGTKRATQCFCKKKTLQQRALKQFFTKKERQRQRKFPTCIDSSISSFDPSIKEALNTFISQKRKEDVPSSYARFTAADFAVASGISVDNATKQLLRIASEVEGALDVSEQGEILYRIPVNFEAILQRKSMLNSLQKLWQPVWSALFYLVRISFGIFLLVSLLIVLGAIIFVNSLNSRQNEDNRSSSFHSPRFYIGPSISDLFYFFRGPSYYNYHYYQYETDNTPSENGKRRTKENQSQKDGPKGFLEAAYSFLFGDGDPNADFETRKWKAVAFVIRANDCVVTAEQLAPYLLCSHDQATSDENSILVNESFMIPALVRFGGIPQVLENGEIIYVFPELRKTAKNVQIISKLPSFPVEKEIPFSRASSTDLWMVALIASLNLVGSLTLGNMFSSPQVVSSVSRELGFSVGFLTTAFQGLLSYAIAFLLVPLARWLYIRRINRQRRKRNSIREKAFRLLENMPDYLRTKVQAARNKALGLEYVGKDPIIYASDKDLAEQIPHFPSLDD